MTARRPRRGGGALLRVSSPQGIRPTCDPLTFRKQAQAFASTPRRRRESKRTVGVDVQAGLLYQRSRSVVDPPRWLV
jgi:hypothetical protein